MAKGGELLLQGAASRAVLDEFRDDCALIDVEILETFPINLWLESSWFPSSR